MTGSRGTITSAFGTRPFTLQDAALAGVSYEALRHAVAAGWLKRPGRGVFSVQTEPGYLDDVRVAARLHPDAIIMGEAAAALHGMWCPRPTGWLGIVMASETTHRRFHRARLVKRHLDGADITTVDGITCTTPARTAMDIACVTTLAEGLVVADSFGRLTRPSRSRSLTKAFRDSIRAELLTTTTRMRHLRGIDRARRVAALANPAAESAPESYGRGLYIAAGRPEPMVGRPVRGADGKTYYADILWPETRRVVEIDGAEKYDDPSVLVAEKCREDAIRAAGYLVTRIMAGDLWRTGIPEERQAA